MIAILPSCGGNRQNIKSVEGFTGTQCLLSGLIDLQKAGIPEGLIKKLQPLVGKWLPEGKFALEVERLIGTADYEAYFPIIINVAHRRRFNKGRECGRYLSCAGITYTGDCCDDRIEHKYISLYTSYTSTSLR